MIIWASLIIPILISFAIGIYTKHFKFWHPIVIIFLCSLVNILTKYFNEKALTNDVERYLDYVVEVKHYNYWSEWIVETCTRECCCTTDSKGNRTCQTETYDCSYEKEYYPYTEVKSKLGVTYRYSEGKYPTYGCNIGGSETIIFNKFKNKFKTLPHFLKDYKRYNYRNCGEGFNGEVYNLKWDGSFETLEYVTWQHYYENRVQASNSIFKHQIPDDKTIFKYKLKPYPKIYNDYKSKCILGYNNSNLDEYANKKNSLIASKKQLKIYYLVFKNQPLESAIQQEHFWGGGNKNEVVICIGLDQTNNITWSYVFSWSKVQSFKINIRNYITDRLSLNDNTFKDIIDFSHNNLVKNFKRREFTEFKYLNVSITLGAVIFAVIFNIILSIGVSIYMILYEQSH